MAFRFIKPISFFCLIILLTGLITTKPALAQEAVVDEESAMILDQLAKDMKNLDSLSLTVQAHLVMTIHSQKEEMITSHRVVFQRPNLMAIELEQGPTGLTAISDGDMLRVLLPESSETGGSKAREYIERPAAQSFGSAMGMDTLPVDPSVTGVFLINDLMGPNPKQDLIRGIKTITYTGESNVDGVPCHHLKVDYGSMEAQWFLRTASPVMPVMAFADMSRVMAMEGLTLTATFNFLTIKANPKTSTQDFEFHIPDQARKVEQFTPMGFEQEGMAGKAAPQAMLTMLQGSPQKLSDLWAKGPVVLDFWAVWCKPCHMILPGMDRLAKDYQGKVPIIAVNLGDDPDQIKTFLKMNGLTLPVALDITGELGLAYQAESIPMAVLIEKGGKIKTVHYGYTGQEEAMLRREIDQLLGQKPGQ